MNLALEQAILESLVDGEKVLLVYKNTPCVVMGRFQNPWLECELDSIHEAKVDLVRRQSGGGSVYHDLNNLNFCFLQKDREHQKVINNEIIISALHSLKIPAYQSERSDLLVDSNGVRKFSGSAFKQKKDRSFHHGTLLIDSDLTRLNQYLHSKQYNIKTNSTKSVRSNVINLKEISRDLNVEKLCIALFTSLENYFSLRCESLTESNYEISQDYYNQLKTWKWIFGETPVFEMISEDGLVLKIKKGIILSIEFESQIDTNSSMINELEKSLIGKLVQKSEFESHFNAFCGTYDMYLTEINTLKLKLYSSLNL
jgi:lipoate-protein ligase A